MYHYIFMSTWIHQKKRLFSLILLAEEKLKDLRKPTSVSVRKHFQIRLVMGEFHTSFQHLIDHHNEMFFFNYLRMSYQSYRDLKDLILTHITQSDQTGRLQIQEKINWFSNYEKYISIERNCKCT